MHAEEPDVDADLFGDNSTELSMYSHGTATGALGTIGGN